MFKFTVFQFCDLLLIIQTVYSQGCGQRLNLGLKYGTVGNSFGNGLGVFGSNVGYDFFLIWVLQLKLWLWKRGNEYGNSIGIIASSPGYKSGLVSSNIGGSGVSSGFGFSGVRTGQLVIEGRVPSVANTYVDGNLPILGLVEFISSLLVSSFVTVSSCTHCNCSQYSFDY